MKAELQIDFTQLRAEITDDVVKAIKPLLGTKSDDNPIYSVEELADYLRVSSKWIYGHTYEIPHFKLGGLLRFRKNEIDRIIDKLALKESLNRS